MYLNLCSIHLFRHRHISNDNSVYCKDLMWLWINYIYCLSMSHVSMEAEKAQDLQLAGWPPRTANVRCKFQSERWSAWDPERAYVSFRVWRRWGNDVPAPRQSDRRCSLLLIGGPGCLLYSGLPLIGRGPPPLRGQSVFLHLPIHMFISPRNTRRHTWTAVQLNVWTPCGSVKLTHEINYYSILRVSWINSSPMILEWSSYK